MAFCGNCGHQLQGDERFCVNCGKDLAAAPTAAAIPVQPVAVSSQLPPGAIPVPVALPQQPAKHGARILMILLVLLVIAAGYYYVTHRQPSVPPGNDGGLLAQQDFNAHWETANGYVQISKARWTNHSNLAIQSATLQCDQYDSAGTDLDQSRTMLNGPLQPGATDVFDSFQMGSVAANLAEVKCTIIGVQPAPGQGE